MKDEQFETALKHAVAEARRFIAAAGAAQKRGETYSKEAGSARRASMDLTRALVPVRGTQRDR